MGIVVFVRGANVGGHRRFRPSDVAKQLERYAVVNVGATGLFVVQNPRSAQHFCAELRRHLPFETQLVACDASDVLMLEHDTPFDDVARANDTVRFVSILAAPARGHLPKMPFGIPSDDEWYVRLFGRRGSFVFGVYRRHLKTISYLGQIDKVLGVPVTTRNWNTFETVLKILKAQAPKATCRRPKPKP